MLPSDLLRRVRRLQIKARKPVAELLAGEFRSVFRGTGVEFDELREYVPGDDIRAIDWNVTARMGRPFVKRYMEERELTVMLLVDLSGSMSFGTGDSLKRERAAELAALLAFSAAQNRDKVGLISFTDRVEQFIPPKKGTRHVLRLIRELLYFRPQGSGTDIAGALRYLNLVQHRKAVVFVISDFFGADYRHDLRLSAKRHDLITVLLRDEKEAALPSLGLVVFTDPETGEQVVVDTTIHGARQRLAAQATESVAWLARETAAAGADLLEIGSSEDYVTKLHRFFRSRERAR
ncbi:DUF58 domain-containing protein [Candidatus Fermentibacteria bacterium]|nr:DUF58 domain-containing protein [Candidatus Fermentibacteria bacterium]